MLRLFLHLLLISVLAGPASSQVEEIPAKRFQGGAFATNHGALILSLVPSKSLLKKDPGVTTLKIFEAKTQKIYLLQYDIGLDFRSPRPWHLPAGKYKILQLIVNTGSGLLQYKGPHAKGITVTAGKVAKLGKWYVIEKPGRNLALIPKPRKKGRKKKGRKKATPPPQESPQVGLPKLPSQIKSEATKGGTMSPPSLPSQADKLIHKPQPAPLTQPKPVPNRKVVPQGTSSMPKLPSQVQRIKKLNTKPKSYPAPGQTPNLRKPMSNNQRMQKPQAQFTKPKAGTGVKIEDDVLTSSKKRKKILNRMTVTKDKDGREYQDIRAVYTVQQTISMFYKIDLKRYNRYAPNVQRVLDSNNQRLRKCYTDRLEVREGIKGAIHFKFLYSKTEKSFRTLKVIKQSVNDKKLVECVYWELSALSFPIKTDMIGDLTLYYDVK